MGGDALQHPKDCLCHTCQATRRQNDAHSPAPHKQYDRREEKGEDGWTEIIQGPPS